MSYKHVWSKYIQKVDVQRSLPPFFCITRNQTAHWFFIFRSYQQLLTFSVMLANEWIGLEICSFNRINLLHDTLGYLSAVARKPFLIWYSWPPCVYCSAIWFITPSFVQKPESNFFLKIQQACYNVALCLSLDSLCSMSESRLPTTCPFFVLQPIKAYILLSCSS